MCVAGDSALNAWVSEAPGALSSREATWVFSFHFAHLASSETQADGAASASDHSSSVGLWSQLTDWPSTAGQRNLALQPLSVPQAQPRPGARALSGLSWNLTRGPQGYDGTEAKPGEASPYSTCI